MSLGVTTGRALTLADVLSPPFNPSLRNISAAVIPLPRGVRILRNSSDSVDSSDGTTTFDRQARLSAAKEKLRDFMDIR
jgi:hypothetical protein